jgi:hypothetical protein
VTKKVLERFQTTRRGTNANDEQYFLSACRGATPLAVPWDDGLLARLALMVLGVQTLQCNWGGVFSGSHVRQCPYQKV